MKKMVRALAVSSLVLAGVFSAANCLADFVLFDNFDRYTDGSYLTGQGPVGNAWTFTMTGASSSPTGMVTRLDNGGLAVFGGPTSPSANYRGLAASGLTIANSSTAATVLWQFRLGAVGTGNNWNFVVTDVNPTDTAGTSEVQFNYDASAANSGGFTTFRGRAGGSFKFLSTDGTKAGDVPLLANSTYTVWMVINNSVDTYTMYLRNDDIPVLSGSAHQLFADDGSGGGSFTFRNSGTTIQQNDLININFGPGSGQTGTTVFDNIYVDIAGQNLTMVPEPSAFALLGVGALALLVFRRRV